MKDGKRKNQVKKSRKENLILKNYFNLLKKMEIQKRNQGNKSYLNKYCLII